MKDYFKRKGGTSRAIRNLAIWTIIATLFIIGILWTMWFMPRKKNYTNLWSITNENQDRIEELERVWASRSIF